MSSMIDDERSTNNNATLYCQELIGSFRLKENVRAINIYFTCIIIVIGLIGNSLGVFVFVQKRFRHHSSSIYLLFLCLFDGLFLLVHFFEDTVRTYIDVYLNKNAHSFDPVCLNSTSPEIQAALKQIYRSESKTSEILLMINITDRFIVTCRIVNFFRYFLRFVSAFLIVAFTMQRTFAIRFPLHGQTIESNKIAWITCSCLVSLGCIINMWVPFFFGTFASTSNVNYCDSRRLEYFYLTIVFIFLIIVIPIVVIFACNSFIVFYLIRANRKRADLSNMRIMSKRSTAEADGSVKSTKSGSGAFMSDKSPAKQSLLSKTGTGSEYQFSLRRGVSTRGGDTRHKTSTKRTGNDSNKITRMLVLMSFSYAILNLPYLLAWCVFFYKSFNKTISKIDTFYYHSFLQICEIFYVLNYACHFYLYCAAGSSFRLLLKKALTTRRS